MNIFKFIFIQKQNAKVFITIIDQVVSRPFPVNLATWLLFCCAIDAFVYNVRYMIIAINIIIVLTIIIIIISGGSFFVLGCVMAISRFLAAFFISQYLCSPQVRVIVIVIMLIKSWENFLISLSVFRLCLRIKKGTLLK